MNYRQATIWDAKVIADMWAETLKEADIPFTTVDGEEFEKLYINVMFAIKSLDHFTWVLDVNGEVKGFITGHVHTVKWGYGGIIANVDCVYVDPEHRGKNHMDELVQLFKDWAKTRQATLTTMETVHNPRLAKIWERKGWKPYKIIYGMEV